MLFLDICECNGGAQTSLLAMVAQMASKRENMTRTTEQLRTTVYKVVASNDNLLSIMMVSWPMSGPHGVRLSTTNTTSVPRLRRARIVGHPEALWSHLV